MSVFSAIYIPPAVDHKCTPVDCPKYYHLGHIGQIEKQPEPLELLAEPLALALIATKGKFDSCQDQAVKIISILKDANVIG